MPTGATELRTGVGDGTRVLLFSCFYFGQLDEAWAPEDGWTGVAMFNIDPSYIMIVGCCI
jgi:hypothetical protein